MPLNKKIIISSLAIVKRNFPSALCTRKALGSGVSISRCWTETNPDLCSNQRFGWRTAQAPEAKVSKFSSKASCRKGWLAGHGLGQSRRAARSPWRFQFRAIECSGGNFRAWGRPWYRKLWNGHHLFPVLESHQVIFIKLNVRSIQPWWLSGLICHVSNSSRGRQLGPEFESLLRPFYKEEPNWQSPNLIWIQAPDQSLP